MDMFFPCLRLSLELSLYSIPYISLRECYDPLNMDKRRIVVTKAHITGVYTDYRSIKQLRVLVFPLDGRPVHHMVVLITLLQAYVAERGK